MEPRWYLFQDQCSDRWATEKRATYTHSGERENFHFSLNLDTMSKLGHVHFCRRVSYKYIRTNQKMKNEKVNLRIWLQYNYDLICYNIIMIWYGYNTIMIWYGYNTNMIWYATIQLWSDMATIQLWSDMLQYKFDLICYNIIMIWYGYNTIMIWYGYNTNMIWYGYNTSLIWYATI